MYGDVDLDNEVLFIVEPENDGFPYWDHQDWFIVDQAETERRGVIVDTEGNEHFYVSVRAEARCNHCGKWSTTDLVGGVDINPQDPLAATITGDSPLVVTPAEVLPLRQRGGAAEYLAEVMLDLDLHLPHADGEVIT